ncbi:MAG: hypothetical protein OEW99_13130 [Gammaproteobacteria bacterium]|nr:hypothetical protein [Gammaproteobacteria bacterium]MDH5660681.1 hypothetical protein [Gammaproteobacteria bacterium]
MGILKNVFGKKEEKTDDDLKAAVLKKATANWNANSESSFINEQDVVVKSDPADIEESKKKNIQTVLLELAERGETGVLVTSISDKAGLSNIDTTTALSYLVENNYAEAINSPTGVKYYLTEEGRTQK